MSLKAIAKELGISVTTVSRALNGYDDVSQETRARVEAEAQRRGYRPNTFARRLKMGKIDAVGLVFPVRPAPLNNNVFLEMVGEISHELARYEIDLLMIADDEQADKHGYMRMVQSRRVDALIVAHTLDDDPRLIQLLSAHPPRRVSGNHGAAALARTANGDCHRLQHSRRRRGDGPGSTGASDWR